MKFVQHVYKILRWGIKLVIYCILPLSNYQIDNAKIDLFFKRVVCLVGYRGIIFISSFTHIVILKLCSFDDMLACTDLRYNNKLFTVSLHIRRCAFTVLPNLLLVVNN